MRSLYVLFTAPFRLLILMPFLLATVIRAPDAILFDAFFGRVGICPEAVMACFIVLLMLLIAVSFYKALGAGAAAAMLFALMKARADQTISTPQIFCGGGKGECAVLVTGADSGVGFEISRALIAQGHSVVLGCKGHKRCIDTKRMLDQSGDAGKTHALAGLDYVSLTKISMWAFNLESAMHAGRFGRLNLVILHSLGTPASFGTHRTQDGFEIELGTTYIAHFALLRFLQISVLAVDVRVVIVSSDILRLGSFHQSLFQHPEGEGDLRGELTSGCNTRLAVCIPPRFDRGFSSGSGILTNGINWGPYARSKLADLLLVRELAQKGISASCVSSGIVFRKFPGSGSTLEDFWMWFMGLVLRQPDVAAAVVLAAARWDTPSGALLNAVGDVLDASMLPSIVVDSNVSARLWHVAEVHVNRWDQTSR